MMPVRVLLAAALAGLMSWSPPLHRLRVSVQVVVLDPSGVPVAGLGQDDFHVVIDGQPGVVDSVSAGASPANVAVLFDVSSSFELTFGRGNLVKAVDAWLARGRWSTNRWNLGSFARRVMLGPRFTADPTELAQAAHAALALEDADRFGPSPAWDAVDAGIHALEPERGRRGIILVTDGRSTGNRLGLRAVLLRALAAGVPVSVVTSRAPQMFALGERMMLLVQPELALQLLADETGGAFAPDLPAGAVARALPGSEAGRLVAQALDLDKLGSLVDRIAEELRHSYLLAFTLDPPSRSAHLLQVVVRQPGLTVRTQKTYLAGTVTSAASPWPAPARPRRP